MNRLCIGTDTLTGRRIYLRPDELLAHAAVIGGTGRGKSFLLQLLARFLMSQSLPALVIDPHGDTYADLLAFATAYHLDDRIICIDLNEAASNWAFPLNFLERNGLDSTTHAHRLLLGLQKVFREQDSETKPRLERRLTDALTALIEAGLTLAESLPFLSVSDSRFRQAALKQVKNPFVLQEWQEFDRIQKRGEKEDILESSLNRCIKTVLSDPIRRTLGAPTCGLDWRRIIAERKTVLVNLQPKLVSRECAQLVGVLLLDHLLNFAMQLSPKENRTPFFVLCDEMDELASPDFGTMWQALRKRNVYVWAFIQYLEQLRSRDETKRLYASAMSNCDIKIAFKTSYEDAKAIVHELFPGEFRGNVLKEEIYRTLLLPRESRRTIVATSESEAAIEGESDSEMDSAAFGTGLGLTENFSFGEADLISEDGEHFLSSQSTGSGAAQSHVQSSAFGSASGRSHTRAKSSGRGRSEVVVPFYEHLRTKELSSRSHYSIQELEERYIACIQQQPQRHATLKLGDNKAVPIFTAFVRPLTIRPQDVERVREAVASRYALPAAKVDGLIAERQQQLVAPPKPKVDDRENWMAD